MNLELLKIKMSEARMTYDDGAKTIGTSITTFNDKMNGKRDFKVPEANALCNKLNLKDDDRIQIFLPRNLHSIQEMKVG